MKKISLNFVKRKIYKALPGKIRLRLLRFFLPELKLELDHIIFRTALTPQDYLASFNLVYRVFVKTGFTRPGPTPFRIAPQHCNPESRIFVGFHTENNEEKLIYSISIFPDSAENSLPMDMVFKKELDTLRAQGRFLVEAGHLAADPSYKMNDMTIPMLGNKIMHQYVSRHLDADDIVMTIHPKYRWIYEDFLLFEKIGEIEAYGYANGNPALAMRLDLRKVEDKYRKAYKNVSSRNNLYHFFFTRESASIILPAGPSRIQKKLLENLKYLYGFNS
ncbi:MAG: N-acyl-L-homoserine lactone synthetase [Desulfobacula sp.]|nr:N-acyl-L-homoserine lactone synthetase [Desulfobacula sp.]